jgi:hybrid cluster-associated redox disulfide protein
VNPNISTDIIVKELLERYPQLLQMFMDMELMCVGCPTEAFHTLTDVSQEYHLDLDQLLERIYETIRNSDVTEVD